VNTQRLQDLWKEFLEAWPPERVLQMTLEEYTNPDKDDAFIYWLESRLDKLGSIWGGSAFKFGIYFQANVKTKEPSGGRVWGEKYAWLSKYGATEQEVFATIRSRLIEVLEAVQQMNLARVEEVDLAPVLKWKVAFLYQDPKRLSLFPIFKKEALFFNYRTIDPRASLASTPYYVMYETLLAQNKDADDVFQLGRLLWGRYEDERNRSPRAWAVPLAWTLQDPDAIELLCKRTTVEPEDIDPFLDNLLAGTDISEGDNIALLVEGDVRALGTLTNVEPGQFSWNQIPVSFPSELVVNPTSEVKLLDASDRQEIWSHLPSTEVPGPESTRGPHFWKIAPGRNAVAWQQWLGQGIASIGWPALGDLTNITRTEFDDRAVRCDKDHGYGKGMSQVWTFHGIRPGDRVVANQGKHSVLGVGTVVEGYRYSPGTCTVDGEDYPHQITVDWDDTLRRTTEQSGWQRTILELSEDDFDALLEQPSEFKAQPKTTELQSNPKSIVVYGPPGTGKTYSTVRRALELILGPEKLNGLGDKGLMALFREHQSRGQIEFVTFHQAYGYEEFVEGIRPLLGRSADAQVRYEIHAGAFKRIALRAAGEGLRADPKLLDFDELWELFTAQLEREAGRIVKSQNGSSYRLSLRGRNVAAQPCQIDEDGNATIEGAKYQDALERDAALYWKFRSELGLEPERITPEKAAEVFGRERGSQAGNNYTVMWMVYSELLALSRSPAARKGELIDRAARVQQALDKPGPSTTFSFSAGSPQYVLIIDEINRGNISKIFGELITLLEPDKRLAERNELKLPLSYTPEHRFAVPPNLHVLGTMNTADRSIALMDVALRRRFTFEELMPDVGVIRSTLRDTTPNRALVELVADVFEALNLRIRFLYDRDHQLGHSYFLDITDAESLRQVFVDRIIPMLQEYFYGSWDKICIVLGCPYDELGEAERSNRQRHRHLLSDGGDSYANPIVTSHSFVSDKALGFDYDDHDDRLDYEVRSAFKLGSLSPEDLYRTFLGILDIEPDTFGSRLAELMELKDIALQSE
jgi:5-methylcytosine-specific restriction endonuclease McrBC GTP-binding regulatory subunit McrB